MTTFTVMLPDARDEDSTWYQKHIKEEVERLKNQAWAYAEHRTMGMNDHDAREAACPNRSRHFDGTCPICGQQCSCR